VRSLHAFFAVLAVVLGVLVAQAPALAMDGCATLGAGWKLDGLYGAYTRRSVEQFQRAHHLQIDGIAGPQTLKALHRPYRGTLRCGTTGAEVRALQEALASSGFWRDGRAHAAARVAMARAHARPPLAARPRPHRTAVRPHQTAARPHRLAVRPHGVARPQPSAVRPQQAPAVQLTLAPRPRPAPGGWHEPVPLVAPSPAGRPLNAAPYQPPLEHFTRPAAEVVPIDVITPPPSTFPIAVAPPQVPEPEAMPTPAPLSPAPDLVRDPEAAATPAPQLAVRPSPVVPQLPVRGPPEEAPLLDPVVEAHGVGWLAARGRDLGTTVPILAGDLTGWGGDWGLEVAATNVDAPPTAALIYDVSAARRFNHGAFRLTAGYEGIGAGLSHMAAAGAAVEQTLGVSWLVAHAGARRHQPVRLHGQRQRRPRRADLERRPRGRPARARVAQRRRRRPGPHGLRGALHPPEGRLLAPSLAPTPSPIGQGV